MHKSKGNISKEIGEENGEVFPSCSNREGKLVNTTFSGGREHTTTVFPFFLESGYSPVADPEEGAAGPGPPPNFWTKLRSEGPKKFFGGTGPPPHLYLKGWTRHCIL